MTFNLLKPILVSAVVLTLAACGSSSSTPPAEPPPTPTPAPPPVANATFEVQVTNLTLAQPLSPIAVILHQSGFNSFVDGETASAGLEVMAEGGDNADVLAEAEAAEQFLVSASSNGPIPPLTIGDAITLTLPVDQLDDVRLSVLSMLVHTNDAFTGVNGSNISNMEVGESIRFSAPTWDAGTENNDELGLNMPGPDFQGEGFNALRDDIIDRVRFHQGVVTSASVESGLAASDLVERHRFDNSTSRIVITRTE